MNIQVGLNSLAVSFFLVKLRGVLGHRSLKEIGITEGKSINCP